MDRRKFIVSASAATAVTAVALQGCNTHKQPQTTGEAALGEIPTDQMAYRRGKHGEQVSLLGYGCMRWPTLPNGQVQTEGPAKGSDIDQEAVNKLVDFAIAHGVNYFDSSPVYCKGFSEQATGIALSRYPRESYYVATKMSNFDSVLWPFEASKQLYENSMKYLQVDYFDFYLLHAIGGGGMENIHKRFLDNGVLDFLLEERKAGRIKNLGFSFHGDIEVFEWAMENHDKYQWDFVQIQHNYADWQNAKIVNKRNTDSAYLYGELAKRDIPVVVMEPLLGGRLASLNSHATAQLKAVEPQRSIASWAFRFAGNQEKILTVLSGMTYMDHLEDNLRTYAPYKPLTPKEEEMLLRIGHEFSTFPTVPCTACQYCMPCPYGLDIPGIFKHFNTCLNEGILQDNQQASDYKRLRKQYLSTYLESVARERQADHCIGCRQCIEHCPQNIDIPGQLRRIDKYEQLLRESL